MQLDGVVVRTIEGKNELRHRECVAGDVIENDSPVLRRPLRSDFATEQEYKSRIERALVAARFLRGEEGLEPLKRPRIVLHTPVLLPVGATGVKGIPP